MSVKSLVIAAIVIGVASGSALAQSSDALIGTWKLNVEKSDFGDTPKARSGSTTYESNGAGYMYIAETVFGENEVARLQSPVEFNGTVHEGHLDERMVTSATNGARRR